MVPCCLIPKRVREQFGLRPGQTLQVIALPGRIELLPTAKRNNPETRGRWPYRAYLCINRITPTLTCPR
jgi:AbrB family looped-hinge helix DNA binding protein